MKDPMNSNDERARDEILTLVRGRAATPEGRAKVAKQLRAALAEIDEGCGCCRHSLSVPRGVCAAIDGLVESLTSATEHAELLREVITPPAR